VNGRLLIPSIAVRSVLALGFVFFGYVALHERFAAFDAAVLRVGLDVLGFDTASVGRSNLTVEAGGEFSIYAIVTGACSSAAGVLGIVAVTVFLLPGAAWRRVVGGSVAATVFVAFNVARIASIILLGWWLAVAGTALSVISLLAPALVCAALVVHRRSGMLVRLSAGLAGGLFVVLLFDVARGLDYSAGMISYHALAGPVLTFGALAVAIMFLWRAIVGPAPSPA
jgi:hypothetical protein